MSTACFLPYVGLGSCLLHMPYIREFAKKNGPITVITFSKSLIDTLQSDEDIKKVIVVEKYNKKFLDIFKKEISDSAVRRVMFEAGDFIDDLMILCRADITTKNPKKIKKYMNNFERVDMLMKNVKMKDEMKAFKSPVDGNEIMKILSLTEGKIVGQIKNAIENAILDEMIPNTYDDAYNYMMKIKDKFV